ncbi:hypothetical protein JTE90_018335 [Oedothorax gibbosus]|uniref:Dynamin GTPase effector domain-containing protein n=1 Tax=Oedothorax gibbosus TaxID=931172 RepID=A0AAV6U197_9ARAC|nr:hypothetical protein JTE90_018335 [Oedothorax gibbosus]
MSAICRKLFNRFIDPLETSFLGVRGVLLDSVMQHASCMDRYPSLKNEVIYRIKSKITQLTEETREKLVDHCMAEQLSVNVGHPDYDIDECSSIAPQVGCTKVWEEHTEVGVADGAHNAARPERREELLRMLLQNDCNKKRTQFVSRMITDYLEIVKKNVSHVYFINIKYFLVFKFMNYLNKKLKIELGSNWTSNLKKTLAQDCEEDFKRKAEMEAKCKYLGEALALIKAF